MMGTYNNDQDYIEELFQIPCDLCKEPGGIKTNAPCGHNLCVSCTQKAYISGEYENGLTKPEKRKSVENPDVTFSQRRNGTNLSGSYLCPIKTCQQVRYKKDDELNRPSFSVDRNRQAIKQNFQTCDTCRLKDLRTNSATHACTHCRLYLCDNCVDVHRHKGIFEGHIILLSTDSRAKFLMGFCKKHDKLQQFRCLDCHSLLCPICLSGHEFGSNSFNSRNSRKKSKCQHKRITNLVTKENVFDDTQQIAYLKQLQVKIDEVRQEMETHNRYYVDVEKIINKSIKNLNSLQEKCVSDRIKVIEGCLEMNEMFSKQLKSLNAKKEELAHFTSVSNLALISPAAHFYLGDKLKEVKRRKHNERFTPGKVQVNLPKFRPIDVSGGSLSFIIEEDIQDLQLSLALINQSEVSSDSGVGSLQSEETLSFTSVPALTSSDKTASHSGLSSDSESSQSSGAIKPIQSNSAGPKYLGNQLLHGRLSSDSDSSQSSGAIRPIPPGSTHSNHTQKLVSASRISSDSGSSQASETIQPIQSSSTAPNYSGNQTSHGRISSVSWSSLSSEEIRPIRPNSTAPKYSINQTSHGRISSVSWSSLSSEEIMPIRPNSTAPKLFKQHSAQSRLSSDSGSSETSEEIRPIEHNSTGSKYPENQIAHGRLSSDSGSSHAGESIRPIQSNSNGPCYVENQTLHGRLSSDSGSSQASEAIRPIHDSSTAPHYSGNQTSHDRISSDSGSSKAGESIRPIEHNSTASKYLKKPSSYSRLSSGSESFQASETMRTTSHNTTSSNYSNNQKYQQKESNNFGSIQTKLEASHSEIKTPSYSENSIFPERADDSSNDNFRVPYQPIHSNLLNSEYLSKSEITTLTDSGSDDLIESGSAYSALDGAVTNLSSNTGKSDKLPSKLSKNSVSRLGNSSDFGKAEASETIQPYLSDLASSEYSVNSKSRVSNVSESSQEAYWPFLSNTLPSNYPINSPIRGRASNASWSMYSESGDSTTETVYTSVSSNTNGSIPRIRKFDNSGYEYRLPKYSWSSQPDVDNYSENYHISWEDSY